MGNLGFKTAIGDHPGQLHRAGPYRWSRNPQLLFYGILLLGYVILYPSWQALAWIVLYGGIAHIMVLTEEEHLGAQFKDEYQNYCRQVPRYIGLGNRQRQNSTKE
jgi:protein-S-isoprenylcysteine O-methyltransferase Ste14